MALMVQREIKRLLLIIILLVPFLSYSQKTYVPDDIFEAWCEGNGYGDGIAFNDSVSTASIVSITDLPLQMKGITDLTGIEDFINVRALNCSNNNLTVLDLSNNTNLYDLNARHNDSLSQVILPDSAYYCSYYENGCIEGFYQIDLSYTNINTLDINRHYRVNDLRLYEVPLISLNPSDMPELRGIHHNKGFLTSLDLSGNAKLDDLDVYDCDSLVELDLRNGNIVNLNNHYLYNNPQLTCISVDNLVLANAILTNIDPWVTFDYNCTGLGCMDSLAMNYDAYATTDDGSCMYCIYGCSISIIVHC